MTSELRIRKFANAFSGTSSLSAAIAQAPLVGTLTNDAVEGYRKKHGGLWVGGVVEISDEGISFRANALNKALNSGARGKTIAMKRVRSVYWQFGWVTGIVVVVHDKGEFRFRCFGARTVVNRLSSHLGAL